MIDAVGSALKDPVHGFWPDRGARLRTWDRGKIVEVIPEFAVREIAPKEEVGAWLYSSIGAWRVPMPGEHRLGKVIDIGRPWLAGSSCDHFLMSTPFLFGDEFENVHAEGVGISIYWLLAITASEAAFARQHGGHALEHLIEENDVDFYRTSRKTGTWARVSPKHRR